jgi:ornithine carbamoyltransferase
MLRHLITIRNISTAQIERTFSISQDLKTKYLSGLREPILPGRMLAMLFEKQSLRTRVSFQAGMTHLGGDTMYLGIEDSGWGKRESFADFARVLSNYVDAIVCRSKKHSVVEQLAEYSSCSVINGLTDWSHPCQALADLFTLKELVGDLVGKKMAFIGDGNNVARSVAAACGRLGVKFHLAAPDGYRFDDEYLGLLRRDIPGIDVEVTADPAKAVEDATAVYTDVWASMGQEAEKEKRKQAFAAYQVNAELMSNAPDNAYFLHCLPANRGQEVTDEVIDGPNSAVLRQAENRMHVQKGILVDFLGPQA